MPTRRHTDFSVASIQNSYVAMSDLGDRGWNIALFSERDK